MNRIGNFSFSPNTVIAGVQGFSAPLSPDEVGPAGDQVDLSEAAATVPAARSGLIAALTALVTSPDYSPPSLPVSQKLIAESLSRAY
jgi:hypothetical protein